MIRCFNELGFRNSIWYEQLHLRSKFQSIRKRFYLTTSASLVGHRTSKRQDIRESSTLNRASNIAILQFFIKKQMDTFQIETSINLWWALGCLVLATPIVTVLYFLLMMYVNYRKLPNVPGFSQFLYFPFKIPILTPLYNIQDWKGVIHRMKTMGDSATKSIRVSLPFYNILVVSDKRMLKELYTSKQSHFDKPHLEYDMLNFFGENLVSALTTETWKHHHHACASAFSTDNLKLMCQTAVESTDLLFDTKWKELSNKQTDKSFMLEPDDFADLTLDVLIKAGFGLPQFGALGKNHDKGLEFKLALQHVTNVGLLIRRYVLINVPFLYPLALKLFGLNQSLDTVREVLQQCIQERKKEIELDGENFARRDILSLLVQANILEKSLTDEEMMSTG